MKDTLFRTFYTCTLNEQILPRFRHLTFLSKYLLLTSNSLETEYHYIVPTHLRSSKLSNWSNNTTILHRDPADLSVLLCGLSI